MLDSVRVHLRKALARQKDEMGFNIAAVKFVLRGVNEGRNKEFGGAEEEFGVAEGKKRGFANLS